MTGISSLRNIWRAPLWCLGLLTGYKSFVDNPILGSERLNRAGLHVWRLKAAHRMASLRRGRLAKAIPADWKARFDRDGFVAMPNFLPPDAFRRLREEILDLDLDCRSQQQGDTITTRIAIGPAVRERIPALAEMLDSKRWKALLGYVGSTRSVPLYYIQSVAGGVEQGPPDPQLELHSDTFQPSMKAWLFLTDVPQDGRPLTYVAGSHRLTEPRIEWERQKSIGIKECGDRLSQRGSFRIGADELPALGLPQPTHFAVPANTLVVADTCGFHARGSSDRPTLRVEIWAYCRRSPFVPWTGFDLLSVRAIAVRQAEWLQVINDWLDRRGWKKQFWAPAGRWNAALQAVARETIMETSSRAPSQVREEMHG